MSYNIFPDDLSRSELVKELSAKNSFLILLRGLSYCLIRSKRKMQKIMTNFSFNLKLLFEKLFDSAVTEIYKH